jgi:hypothetical protein
MWIVRYRTVEEAEKRKPWTVFYTRNPAEAYRFQREHQGTLDTIVEVIYDPNKKVE